MGSVRGGLSWGGLIASALALGIGSPLAQFPWLACVLFVPLAWLLGRGCSILAGGFTGWVFGTLSWASGTIWVLHAMDTLMGLSSGVSWAAAVLIWLYQGMPFAVLGGVCGWMNQRDYPAGPLFCASLLTLLVFFRPVLFPISAAVAVALWPPFIQIADLGGVLGVFFVLILINWLIAACLPGGRKRPGGICLCMALPVILLVAVLGYGTFRIHEFRTMSRDQRAKRILVASVQPNIPVLWRKETIEGFATDATFCVRTLRAHPQELENAGLVVFPEMPRFDCRSREFYDSGLGGMLERLGIPVLLPSNTYILDSQARSVALDGMRRVDIQRIEKKLSAVFSWVPRGGWTPVHTKVKRVPFSETLPLADQFPLLKKAFGLPLEISRGDGPGQVTIQGLVVQPLICFETGFPGLVRQGVAAGADLLAEVSNDGWFVSKDAELKHLSMGIFRAAAFRRPLVRCSNSGAGAHVDALGTIVPGSLTPHGEAGITRGQLVSPDTVTLFSRWGHTWLWGAVLVVVLGVRTAIGRAGAKLVGRL